MSAKKIIITALILVGAIAVSVLIPLREVVSSVMTGMSDIPIFSVDTPVRCVALTMNLEAYINIEKLNEVLGNEKMTFFVGSYYENSYASDIIKLKKCGHSIGILERDMNSKSKKEVYTALTDRLGNFTYMTSANADLVRFESYDSACVKSTFDLDLFPVQWSGNDTTEAFSNGDIILVKDIESLKKTIKRLKNSGFTLVTVDELIYRENFRISENGVQVQNNN